MAQVNRSPWVFFFLFPSALTLSLRLKGFFRSKRVPSVDAAAQLSHALCEQQEPMAAIAPFSTAPNESISAITDFNEAFNDTFNSCLII